ncbi:SHC-transforming protein 3-like isoform X2 [Panonychus citri]|uniref:SHC-transforming protein 3-like isoform X2 n=1 Tax=Panonychus citri TaxID=50023 RepID=UPI002307A88D|nr:SHC-transforming protein 3-like isoform X2 [Panonychus citri]
MTNSMNTGQDWRFFSLKYVGCLEINTPMKSLDFDTRSKVAKECINRVCEASGLKTVDKKRRPDKRICKMLADRPNMDNAGSNVNLEITSGYLKLSVMETGEIIAKHDMPNISFASGGDSDTLDFVAYVAKDDKFVRACFVLECGGGKAQDVISIIGQAFELRFKEFLKKQPHKSIQERYENRRTQFNGLAYQTNHGPVDGAIGGGGGCGGDDRDYYNDMPGKVPPDLPERKTDRRNDDKFIRNNNHSSSGRCSIGKFNSQLLLPSTSDLTPNLIDLTSDLQVMPNESPITVPLTAESIIMPNNNNVNTLTTTTTSTTITTNSTPLSSSSSISKLRTISNNSASCSRTSSFNCKTEPEYVNCNPDELFKLSATESSSSSQPSAIKDPFDMQPFCGALENLSNDMEPSSLLSSISPINESFKCGLDDADHKTQTTTVNTNEDLAKAEWFHGAIGRRESEMLVVNDGDFLVRESLHSPGKYVLTGMQGGLRKHFTLVDPEGVVRTKACTFDSVTHLINYYRDNQLPLMTADSELVLINPIIRRSLNFF